VLTQLTRNLVRAAPMQLRVGGGAADNTYFTGVGGARGNCSVGGVFGVDTCVDAAYFSQLCAFAAASGAELVFDLNAALREPAAAATLGAWNASNARSLFEFLSGPDAPAACPLAAWQLGNEIEDWYKRRDENGVPMNMSGQAHAADLAALRSLLRSDFPSLQQTIYGPDACCEDRAATPAGTWMRNFSAAAVGSVDAVTIHIYPLPRFANNSCEPPLFTNKSAMGSLIVATLQYAEWSAALLAAGAPLIVGETATSAHGGCDGLSNRFVAGFTFWFELGTYAELGVAQINRQDLAGFSSETEPSNYVLLGPPGWARGELGDPHPDYFSALIFKQLVGRSVLKSGFTSDAANVSEFVDVHVFCASGVGGGIVLTYFNMGQTAVEFSLPQLGAAPVPREEFLLTSSALPGGANITADEIYLNGERMAVNADGTLPAWPIRGRVAGDTAAAFVAPPWSYGAVSFPSAGAAACAA